MPKGPRGEHRPKDVIGNAVEVARIAVGDEDEELEPDTKGAARAKSLSAKKRSDIAKEAAAKRWKKK